MIINALCDAYDRIAKDENAEIARDGAIFDKIKFVVVLNSNGTIKEIIHNDNKEKLPETKNILWGNSSYTLGLAWDKDNKCFIEAKDKKGKSYFDEFKTLNNFVGDIKTNDLANAFYNFLNSWNPSEHLLDYTDDFAGNLAFAYEDITKRIWLDKEILSAIPKNNNLDERRGQCAITGKEDVLSSSHNFIKGVMGITGMSGGTFAAFKNPSLHSYGKKEAYNSSVGETVMRKYTAALNYFLRKESKNKTLFGKDTCVFWAESDNEDYIEEVWDLFGITKNESDDSGTESKVLSTLQQIKKGTANDGTFKTDNNTKFHILILSPNTARISVRRYYNTSFGKFKNSALQHHKDMLLLDSGGEVKQTPMWQLLDATVPSVITQKRNENINPSFAGALSESIINCYAYPNGMYLEMLMRVKTDISAKSYLTHKRISFIKAYIVRKDRKLKKEEIKMELNKDNTDVAYNLGRLFAILEKTQQDAIPGANTTIKDRFFASACSTPATVFPTLLIGYQNHISKLDKGAIRYEKLLQEIFPKLGDAFPKQLDLDGQGRFIIGYYQQNTALWTKQETKEDK